MKKLIFIAALISVCLGCIACNNKTKEDSISNIVEDKPYTILFDFSNIDTITYVGADDEFCVLHYCDYDVFDYDNLAYLTGREHWYGEYIAIDVEDEILSQFLNDYSNYKSNTDYQYKQELNDKYIIIEHDITYQDSSKDIIFYIGINDEEND